MDRSSNDRPPEAAEQFRPVDGESPDSDLRHDETGRPAPSLRHPLPLLESLFSDHLDPGYQAAADRRAARASGPSPKPAP